MSEDLATRTLRPVQHETKDVRFGFVAKLLAFIASVLLLLLAVAYGIFPGQVQDRRFHRPFPDYPTPQLQPSPRADMAAFYAAEMARLNGLGWQDRGQGIVHIPIEQAMRDIARDGIPGWPAGRADVSQGDRR